MMRSSLLLLVLPALAEGFTAPASLSAVHSSRAHANCQLSRTYMSQDSADINRRDVVSGALAAAVAVFGASSANADMLKAACT
eukprot:302077-Rhodomonas_salina.2